MSEETDPTASDDGGKIGIDELPANEQGIRYLRDHTWAAFRSTTPVHLRAVHRRLGDQIPQSFRELMNSERLRLVHVI